MSNRKTLTVLFFILSFLFSWYALVLGGWFFLLLWPAFSFLLVGAAYAGLGPSLMAKRSDGSFPMQTYILLGPYLFLSWVGWMGLKLAQGKEPFNEVAPGIFVSRRLQEEELPEDISVIVDMTCELATLHPTQSHRKYICVPTLDATAPEEVETLRVLSFLREERGAILVHCAAGHGRSAMFAAALVLMRGLATNEEEAEKLLQKNRKKIKLNLEQRARLRRLFASS